MKKVLGYILVAIVSSGITVGAAHVFDASDVSYNPSDETWNVENASDAIESLKSDLQASKSDIKNYKSDIIEALSSKGVSVDKNSSMEEITNGIEELKKELKLVDKYAVIQKNITIDVDAESIVFITLSDPHDNKTTFTVPDDAELLVSNDLPSSNSEWMGAIFTRAYKYNSDGTLYVQGRPDVTSNKIIISVFKYV